MTAAEALEASIAHWAKNMLAAETMDATVDRYDCALCSLFWEDACVECPVAARTGSAWCYGSPYTEARDALWAWRDGTGDRATFIAAATAEHDFLVSLREARQ